MQGLNYQPRPFINRVSIENGKSEGTKLPSHTDLYYAKPAVTDAPPTTIEEKIKLSFDVVLKSLYPIGTKGDNNSKSIFLKEAIKTANTHVLYYKFITNKSVFEDFLLSENKIGHFINGIPGSLYIHDQIPTVGGGKNYDLSAYTYYANNRPVVNIPTKFYHLYTPKNGGAIPTFLACVFMYGPPPGESLTSANSFFTSEVIFRKGVIPQKTGYFTIGDKYLEGGAESPLQASPAAIAQQAKDQGTESASEYIISKYGHPGGLWCGPVYRHKVSGAYRYMPGNKHGPNARPYLNLKVKTNDKIIDNRVTGIIENMFVYNSPNYERFFNAATQTTYKGVKKKSTIDGYNDAIAIVSEVDYSVHEIMTSGGPKGKINIWFAIDKLRMLKSTSILAPLLDKLTVLNSDFVGYFVGNMEIFNFQISRINLRTGERALLLTAPNDVYADDSTKVNYLGNSIAKGHIFKRIKGIEVGVTSQYIDYYEFRDGELDVNSYDDGHYTYEISLKFKDPILAYLTQNVTSVRAILKDLDELLVKTSLKIADESALQATPQGGSIYGASTTSYNSNKMVDVYNRYYDKLNPVFVQKALTGEAYINFNFIDEIPESIARAFRYLPDAKPDHVSNVVFAFACLDSSNDLEPLSEYGLAWDTLLGLSNFIRVSTVLSNTTPTLLIKVRSLLGLLEDRMTKLLSLYSLPVSTKKEGGFAYTDYIKTQGDLSTPARTNDSSKVISFNKVFTESIDLYKLRNHFDWLGGTGASLETHRLLKSIDDVQYKTAVNKSLSVFTGPNVQEKLGDAAEVSFIPYLTGKSLALFNATDSPMANTASDFIKKSYQTMRKRLYGLATDKKSHISIPEILSYFGVRFEMDLAADIQNIYEQEQAQKAVAINNLFWTDKTATGPKFYKKEHSSDNFGTPYTPIATDLGGFTSEFGTDPGAYTGVNPFGSVANPNYDWQGAPLQKYPLKMAKSLITLLFSDNLKNYRNLSLFNVKTSDFFLGFTVGDWPEQALAKMLLETTNTPPPMSLLAAVGTTGPNGESIYGKEKLDKLFFNQFFDKDNNLKLENYSLYMLYLSLFGRVYYFQGFEESATLDQKTPTSFYFKNQIKSKIWAPLTKEKLSTIAPGRSLYCKVEPFTNGKHIDKKFMELFLGYGQYNSHFYIRGTGFQGLQKGTPGLTLGTTLPTPGTVGGAGTGDSTVPMTAQLPPNLINLAVGQDAQPVPGSKPGR
jgi:hypothetical protein